MASRPAWQPELDLGSGGLGMDSLELLSVATALTETLHLHRSGIEDYLLARRTVGDWVRIAAQALSVFDAEITFRTSGSTGTPKPCRHPLSALECEAAALARIFGPKQRVTGMVPAHHIYGFLFTILLPRLLGAEYADGQGRLPSRVAADLTAGDLLVAVPEHWAALARSAPADLSDVAGVCSTGPLDPLVFRTLRDSGLDLIGLWFQRNRRDWVAALARCAVPATGRACGVNGRDGTPARLGRRPPDAARPGGDA